MTPVLSQNVRFGSAIFGFIHFHFVYNAKQERKFDTVYHYIPTSTKLTGTEKREKE